MAKLWAKGFYNSTKWKKCRRGYVASVNGLCERCLAKGKIETGKIVHHTIHLTPENIHDPYTSLNWDNLELLCQDCHNEHHHSVNNVTVDGVVFDDNGDLIKG